MGGLIVRVLPWAVTAAGAAMGLKSAGDGISKGTRNALTILAAGAAAYLILKRGK